MVIAGLVKLIMSMSYKERPGAVVVDWYFDLFDDLV